MIPYTTGDAFQSPAKPRKPSPSPPSPRVAPQSPTLSRVQKGRFVPEPLQLSTSAKGALLQASDSPPPTFTRTSEQSPVPQPLFGARAPADHTASPRSGSSRVHPTERPTSPDRRATFAAQASSSLIILGHSASRRDGALLSSSSAGEAAGGGPEGSLPPRTARSKAGGSAAPPQPRDPPGRRRSSAKALSPDHQPTTTPTTANHPSHSLPLRRGSSPLGTMPARLSLHSNQAGPSEPSSARGFGVGPSRYLLTVVPPLHLPHDPPHPRTSGACSGYGPPSQFR